MSLPPLANLFAVHDADPSALGGIASDLQSSGEFAEVWRPVSGWVAAAAPLPRGEPDSASVRRHGLAFVEGRDRVVAKAEPERDARALAELADATPERLASLAGDFGFVRFRPDASATIVRSCGGLAPFYFWRSDGRAAVSTRLGDFVRYLPGELGLDALVNGLWAGGRALFPDGRTFLEGVKALERGHFATIEPGKPIGPRSYWNPRPQRIVRPTPATVQEHAARLRSILVHRLTEDLDPSGGNLLTLSGGVDSSALGALAVGVAGKTVSTFSVLPAPPALFEHEMSFIRPLARQYSFERCWSIRVLAQTRVELLQAAPRIVFHAVHPAFGALPTIQQEAPLSVLFGGEFADETCGSVVRYPDWVAHTGPLDLLAGVGRLPYGPRDLLRWTKQRMLSRIGRPWLSFPEEMPEFLSPGVRDQYRDWRTRRARNAVPEAGALLALALRAEEDGFLAMNWEATSALGVRRSFPFFNRELLELAYECHPAELLGPGPKKILRLALRHDVPARNLDRQDKGHWGAYLRGLQLPWSTPLPEALQPVLRPEWYPRPPDSIERDEARALCQLTLFVEALVARRSRRTARGAGLDAVSSLPRVSLDRQYGA